MMGDTMYIKSVSMKKVSYFASGVTVYDVRYYVQKMVSWGKGCYFGSGVTVYDGRYYAHESVLTGIGGSKRWLIPIGANIFDTNDEQTLGANFTNDLIFFEIKFSKAHYKHLLIHIWGVSTVQIPTQGFIF